MWRVWTTATREKRNLMRDTVLVMNERRALVAYSTNTKAPISPEFLRFLRGAGAALDWASGVVPAAPVSTGQVVANPETIAAEVRQCDALLVGASAALFAARTDPHYLNGVEHALRWMLELEAEPPVPLDNTSSGDATANAEAAPAA